MDAVIVYYSSSPTNDYRYSDALSAFLSMMIGEPQGSMTGSVVNKEVCSEGGYTNESWIAGEEFRPNNSRLERATRDDDMLKRRTLVITERGYMGLSPWHVKEDFTLAILLRWSHQY